MILNVNLSYKYNSILRIPTKQLPTCGYILSQNYDRTSTIKGQLWLAAFDCSGTIHIKRVTKSYFDKADKITRAQEFIVLTMDMRRSVEKEFNTTISELKLIEVRDGYDIKIRYGGSKIFKGVLTKNFISWIDSIHSIKLNHDLNLLQNK